MTVLELRKLLYALPREHQCHKVVAFVDGEPYQLTSQHWPRGTDEIAFMAREPKSAWSRWTICCG